jgi:hypothetical protein
MMKKARLIAGVTAAIPAAAGGFAAPAAAHAAQATTVSAHQVSVKGKTVLHYGIRPDTYGRGWYSLSAPETAYFRNGGQRHMTQSSEVSINCYYTGNTGYADPYWDHFTKWYIVGTRYYNYQSGHIADAHVDMEGVEAPQNGIPHC